MLLDALRSVAGEGVERIVVDNGSTDGSPEAAGALGPDVRLLRTGSNVGYAQACDLAASEARGEFLMFLNNDATLEPGCLDRLLEEADIDQRTAVWQPVVTADRSGFESAGGMFTRAGFIWRLSEPLTDRPYPVFTAMGPCLLVRRRVFEDVGGFDPSLFAYSEDVDLCWQVRLAGYEVKVVPRALVLHRGGTTTARILSPERIYHLGYRNRLRTILANSAPLTLAVVLPIHLAASLAVVVGFLVRGRPAAALAIARGLVWPLTNIGRIRARRGETKRIRLLSDTELLRPDLMFKLTPARALQLFRGSVGRWA